jgi:DtxR family Mn-dependent transcriptional regulator
MSEGKAPDLSSNLEDYLEAIAHLEEQSRVARSRDIALRLGVTKASVTAALRALGERGLVNYQPYSHITLTAQGQALAREVIRRHETISRFFHEVLGMEPGPAEANACRVEHAVDDEVMARLGAFLEALDSCPRSGAVWRQALAKRCACAAEAGHCRTCLRACLESLPDQPGGSDPAAKP